MTQNYKEITRANTAPPEALACQEADADGFHRVGRHAPAATATGLPVKEKEEMRAQLNELLKVGRLWKS